MNLRDFLLEGEIFEKKDAGKKPEKKSGKKPENKNKEKKSDKDTEKKDTEKKSEKKDTEKKSENKDKEKKSEKKDTEKKPEKNKSEKYSYKDPDGNKITIMKDKDGKVYKIDSGGNKSLSTDLDLKIAREKKNYQSSAKEWAKEKAKAEIKADRSNSDKESNFGKHLEDTASSINNKLSSNFGLAGVLISMCAELTIGSIYKIGKDVNQKIKDKRTERLAIIKRTNELIESDDKYLSELDDEAKKKLDDSKAAYNKILSSAYDDDGKLADDKKYTENLKSTFNDDKEYDEFIEKQKKINKSDKDLEEKVNKIKKDISKDDMDNIIKDLPNESKKEKKKVKAYKETYSKYNKDLNDLKDRHSSKNESDKAKLDQNNSSIENLEKEKKKSEDKLKNLEKKKPKDMSDIEYEAEKKKLRSEIDLKNKNINSEKAKVEKKYKDSLELNSKEYKKEKAKIQTEFDDNMSKYGINTANTMQKNSEKKVNKNSERLDKNDEKLEEEDPSKLQDPRKVWKNRTYKRGDSTVKTKSFYNKDGESISKAEMDKKINSYNKKKKEQEKTGENNESISNMSLRDYITECLNN